MTYSKIKISAEIVVMTGLHIGGSSAFAAIGATDSPVVRDTISRLPLIPGSSIKGKMRSLLARAINDSIAISPSQDALEIRRLFGDSNSEDMKQGKLIFRDSILKNADELIELGARTLTEVKFENTLNRKTLAATPRQIERVLRGSKFDFELIYNIEDDQEILDDFSLIKQGFELLELDYLGGNGSRGYGRIRFEKIELEAVFGKINDDILQSVQTLFK